MARVEQRARHDPDGVREVDDPRVGRGERANAVGDAEDDRHGSQGLREAAGAGRLLADTAAREREGLVDEPCLLAADPDLDQDVVGVRDGPVEVVGHLDLDAGALTVEHPLCHRTDHLAPLGVDVLEHELGDSERVLHARKPGHELRRVGRAASDHGDLHQPFTPVSGDALDERLLREQEENDHRHHHDECRGHRQVPLDLMQGPELGEPDRERPVVRVLAGVEQRPEEVVEAEEEREQSDRRDRRLCEPEHDRVEDPHLAAAVDARRVEVLLGDREEELAQQEDRERIAEPVRKDQRPERADEVQLRPDHVDGDDGHLRR